MSAARRANAAASSGADIGPVLILTPWYPPTMGGVAAVAARIRSLLAGAGISTAVWVSDATPDSVRDYRGSDHVIPGGVIPSTVFYAPGLKGLVGTLLRAPGALWRAYRLVRSHGIKVIILTYPIGYAWPFVVLRWLRVIRLVSSCHGNEVLQFSRESPFTRWLFRRVMLASDAITVPAAHLIPVMREVCGGRALPIWLIPNCVDDVHFVPRPPESPRPDRATLVHVSIFTPKKRTLDIVAAFARARLPANTRLLMVGDGPEHRATRELAAQLGVADRVEFTGSRGDVRPYLWESDLLVMASDEESGPISLLEAMACEVPWIMTPWGIAVTLGSGEYGVIVPARSPEALAAAMETMLADPARLRAMGARGRRKVLEEFGQTTYLERHLTLLRAVAAGRGHEAIDYSVRVAPPATSGPGPAAP